MDALDEAPGQPLTRPDFIDLHWLPVGAGTHFQRASLLLYEGLAAAMSRRSRSVLCHAALKLGIDGRAHTLELMPIPAHQDTAPLITGSVGSTFAGRLRLFRYQLCLKECARLPDEQWTIGAPLHLSTDATTVHRLLQAAATVPAHVWGRRYTGTSEMWTSNSAVSWMLTRAGIDAAAIALPAGTRAPGWYAGLEASATTAPPIPGR